MRDYWGEPSGEPRPDYRDAVEPDVPIEHEGKPARGERVRHSAEMNEALAGYEHRADVPDLLGDLARSMRCRYPWCDCDGPEGPACGLPGYAEAMTRCVHGRLPIDPCVFCAKESGDR